MRLEIAYPKTERGTTVGWPIHAGSGDLLDFVETVFLLRFYRPAEKSFGGEDEARSGSLADDAGVAKGYTGAGSNLPLSFGRMSRPRGRV